VRLRLIPRAPALLLALPLLLGGGPTGASVAARGTQPDAGDDVRPSLATAATPTRVSAASTAMPTSDTSRVATWPQRIEARLAELGSVAAREPGPTAPVASPLSATLSALAGSAEGHADIGVAVHELDSGAPVFHHAAERTLNPASNHKLLTAIAAVELLGADYRFTTRVLLAGDTLYVVGEGDPSLQIEDVAGLAARTAAAVAPHRVRRIVVDDTFFSARRHAPGYDDGGPGFSYLAPSGALSLQWNTVEIVVRPGRPGEAPHVTTSPDCPHLRIENHAITGRGGGLTIATRAGGDATVVAVDGRISARKKPVRIRRRITDPGLYLGETFADRFTAHGDGPRPIVERGRAPEAARLVADHDSAPLPEVLTSALSYSNNFTTEQVLRTLGARATGEPGDWANGRDVIERFFTTIGREPGELVFVNASGYSREGRLSADAIVALLQLVAREGSASAALLPALPTPGGDGTLRGRLGRARGLVRAKTGTLRDASALSGIVQTQAGHRYGFSILVNGRLSSDASRRIQDRIVTALVELG
jgi:D-alanyl-D-alanine carboxypeptidase/D-alanyl-D-alanine-endopeptidase (penicillin-binding protein 4)